MALGALILPFSAAVTFGWGCAVMPPIARAIRTALARPTRATGTAVVLAVLSGALWTMCALAAAVLSMIAAPNAWLAALSTPMVALGAAGGLGVWVIVTVATQRMPRLGPSFEVTTAMAIVLVVTEEPAVTASIEQLYRLNAVA